MSERDGHEFDAWLDPLQAAALIGVSTRRIATLLEDGTLRATPSAGGRAGVMKAALMAWRERDRTVRLAALTALAAEVDHEVFG